MHQGDASWTRSAEGSLSCVTFTKSSRGNGFFVGGSELETSRLHRHYVAVLWLGLQGLKSLIISTFRPQNRCSVARDLFHHCSLTPCKTACNVTSTVAAWKGRAKF